ncbi:HAPLESS, HAP2 [Carpediemonas membranifera]|uniref:HAPLESS, HAP2 n=1 Tax=Carpediemonas membranifera TaxID=201153 RepID=A0A8J6B1T5_9EUKA|nr:HAPLESS, HAP2 [Carpediemonas membranifera]|eukprot:KAG9391187.1 HAPLESS, HAP2 [Carpediemonas membranifera]
MPLLQPKHFILIVLLIGTCVCSTLLSATVLNQCTSYSTRDGRDGSEECIDKVRLYFNVDSSDTNTITVTGASDTDGNSYDTSEYISVKCSLSSSSHLYTLKDTGKLYDAQISETMYTYSLFSTQCSDSLSDYSCPEVRASIMEDGSETQVVVAAGRGRCCDISCLLSSVASNDCRYTGFGLTVNTNVVTSVAHCPVLSGKYYDGSLIYSRNQVAGVDCLLLIGDESVTASVSIASKTASESNVTMTLQSVGGDDAIDYTGRYLLVPHEGAYYSSDILIVPSDYMCKAGEVNCIGSVPDFLEAYREQAGFCSSKVGTGLNNQIADLINKDTTAIQQGDLPEFMRCINEDCSIIPSGLSVAADMSVKITVDIEGHGLFESTTVSYASITEAEGSSFTEGTGVGTIACSVTNEGSLDSTYVLSVSECDLDGLAMPDSQTATIAAGESKSFQFEVALIDIDQSVSITCSVLLQAASTAEELDSASVVLEATDLEKTTFSGGGSVLPDWALNLPYLTDLTGSVCSSVFSCIIGGAGFLAVAVVLVLVCLCAARFIVPKLFKTAASTSSSIVSSSISSSISGFSSGAKFSAHGGSTLLGRSVKGSATGFFRTGARLRGRFRRHKEPQSVADSYISGIPQTPNPHSPAINDGYISGSSFSFRVGRTPSPVAVCSHRPRQSSTLGDRSVSMFSSGNLGTSSFGISTERRVTGVTGLESQIRAGRLVGGARYRIQIDISGIVGDDVDPLTASLRVESGAQDLSPTEPLTSQLQIDLGNGHAKTLTLESLARRIDALANRHQVMDTSRVPIYIHEQTRD